MDTKTIVIGASAIVAVVTIAGGGVYYSPYLTLNKMRNATENQNVEALAKESPPAQGVLLLSPSTNAVLLRFRGIEHAKKLLTG